VAEAMFGAARSAASASSALARSPNASGALEFIATIEACAAAPAISLRRDCR